MWDVRFSQRCFTIVWDVTPYNLMETLKMEAADSSETFVFTYRTTLCLFPEDHNFDLFSVKIRAGY
jgi:hypothetical protein